jgi:hypothetical protein
MMRLLRLFRRWTRLRPAERRLAVQAWVLLAASGALLRCASLDRLVRWRVPFAGAHDLSSARIASIIAGVGVAHPCHPACLEQALVATWALRAGGAAPQLVLSRAPVAPFGAHASLRLDGRALFGGTADQHDELFVFEVDRTEADS